MYDTLMMPHDASRLRTIDAIFCIDFRQVQKMFALLTISDNRDYNCVQSYVVYMNATDVLVTLHPTLRPLESWRNCVRLHTALDQQGPLKH